MYRLRILEYHCASTISLADRVFLQELAHVSTGEQMGNVYVTVQQLHEHHLPNMMNFISFFSIAQFYKSNLITHVFVRESHDLKYVS